VLTEPSERLVAHMNALMYRPQRPPEWQPVCSDEAIDKPFFDATLTLEYRAWTARNVGVALARYPLMTAQVIGAIHWEALRLWIKQVPVFTHPDRVAAGIGEATKRV
jgi:DUF1365 family protein